MGKKIKCVVYQGAKLNHLIQELIILASDLPYDSALVLEFQSHKITVDNKTTFAAIFRQVNVPFKKAFPFCDCSACLPDALPKEPAVLPADFEEYLQQYNLGHEERLRRFKKKIVGFAEADPHTKEMREKCWAVGLDYDKARMHNDDEKILVIIQAIKERLAELPVV